MSVLSPQQIAQVCRAVGFPAPEIATAVAVALAESGGRTDATNHNTNGSIDYGLFQINSIHAQLLAQGDWRDPLANARMAYALWQDNRGWTPWSSYNNGRYRLFLGAGSAAGSTFTTAAFTTSAPSSVLSSAFDVFSPRFWLRVGMFLLGGLLLLLALWRFLPTTLRAHTRTVAEMAAVA